MSSGSNCTGHLLALGELGGAGAPGGGVMWLHVLSDAGWGRGLCRAVTAPSIHIYRDPLHHVCVGTVGPLRGCDSAASHFTGCTLVPVDQPSEQESGGTGMVSKDHWNGLMEYSLLTKKSPKLCATAPEGPWKKFPCMGTCTIYRQVGTADDREEQGTRACS